MDSGARATNKRGSRVTPASFSPDKCLTSEPIVVYYHLTPIEDDMMKDHELDAAMQTTEADVPTPAKNRAASMISQIAALKVGETTTRTLEIQGDVTLSEIAMNLAAWKRGLSSSVGSSVNHAKKRIRGESAFSVDTSHTMTQNGRLFIIAIVTRSA